MSAVLRIDMPHTYLTLSEHFLHLSDFTPVVDPTERSDETRAHNKVGLEQCCVNNLGVAK